MLAIIGGSGLAHLPALNIDRREVVRTPHGEPSGVLSFGHIAAAPVVFLPRHGHAHTIAPHRVNYRANIWALVKEARAEAILSIASVGGIRADLGPGALATPHQIIDYTWGRASTFHDGDGEGEGEMVRHVDFTHPYDPDLRARLLAAAAAARVSVHDGAVYAATQGPRLESAAEIDRLERDGADVVGMTGMPEAALARELQTPYAALCIVANYAAGRDASGAGISISDIGKVTAAAQAQLLAVIESLCADMSGT